MTVQNAFVEAGLTPSVVPVFNPTVQLDVTYDIPNNYTCDPDTKQVFPGRNFTVPREWCFAERIVLSLN